MAIGFVSSIFDLKRREIPNSVIVLGAFGGGALGLLNGHEEVVNIGARFLVGFVFLVLWKFDIIGGGDAKLLWLLGLSVPLAEWVLFVPFVGVWGGVLAVVYGLVKSEEKVLPYGLAILGGYITWALFLGL